MRLRTLRVCACIRKAFQDKSTSILAPRPPWHQCPYKKHCTHHWDHTGYNLSTKMSVKEDENLHTEVAANRSHTSTPRGRQQTEQQRSRLHQCQWPDQHSQLTAIAVVCVSCAARGAGTLVQGRDRSRIPITRITKERYTKEKYANRNCVSNDWWYEPDSKFEPVLDLVTC